MDWLGLEFKILDFRIVVFNAELCFCVCKILWLFVRITFYTIKIENPGSRETDSSFSLQIHPGITQFVSFYVCCCF